MLCVIGDLVEDGVVGLPTVLSYGTYTPSKIVRTRGGSASNVAVFAATVNSEIKNDSRKKFRSRLIAQVGDDALGDQLVTTLETAKVDTCVVRSGRTGSIVVIVSPDGERTMLTDRAAATELKQAPENWYDDVSVLHVPAYSLFSEPLSTAARKCIAVAHEKKIAVSIDASSASLIKSFGITRFRELIAELNPKIFFCNTYEAEVLNLAAQPLELDIVVIKAGAAPTTLIFKSGHSSIDVSPVGEITDSTGAGDAFAAGFLTKFDQTYIYVSPARQPDEPTLRECVLAGHQLAARVLRSPGATMEA
ncbi:MAG: carbohydrate kinase family protein [Acidimicrobiaceae bacterium]